MSNVTYYWTFIMYRLIQKKIHEFFSSITSTSIQQRCLMNKCDFFFRIRPLVLFFVRIFEFLNEPCNIRTYMLIFNFASKGSKFVSVTQKIVDKRFFHTIKVCNTTFLSVYLQEIDFNFQGFQEQITCVYEFSFQSIEHFNEYILNEMTDQLINDENKLVRNTYQYCM